MVIACGHHVPRYLRVHVVQHGGRKDKIGHTVPTVMYLRAPPSTQDRYT